MFWMTLFRNDKKEDGDSKPLYQNNSFTPESDIVLKAGQKYNVALWKKSNTKDGRPMDGVTIKMELNTYFTEEIKVDEEVEQVPF